MFIFSVRTVVLAVAVSASSLSSAATLGHVAELVGIVGGVVSGVINLESSGA